MLGMVMNFDSAYSMVSRSAVSSANNNNKGKKIDNTVGISIIHSRDIAGSMVVWFDGRSNVPYLSFRVIMESLSIRTTSTYVDIPIICP